MGNLRGLIGKLLRRPRRENPQGKIDSVLSQESYKKKDWDIPSEIDERSRNISKRTIYNELSDLPPGLQNHLESIYGKQVRYEYQTGKREWIDTSGSGHKETYPINILVNSENVGALMHTISYGDSSHDLNSPNFEEITYTPNRQQLDSDQKSIASWGDLTAMPDSYGGKITWRQSGPIKLFD